MKSRDPLLPQNLDAERSLLGAMLLNGSAIQFVAKNVQQENLYDSKHKTLFNILLHLYKDGGKPDLVVIEDQLRQNGKLKRTGGPEYIRQLLSESVSAANVDEYVRLVKEAAEARQMYIKTLRVQKAIQEGKYSDAKAHMEMPAGADSELIPHDGDSRSRGPYRTTSEGISYIKSLQDGPVSVPLTNFKARIITSVARDDGIETERHLELECERNGHIQVIHVPAKRFSAMTWPMEHLGPEAIVHAGASIKDHARTAIQMLSTDIKARRVYTHTGWTQIEDRWIFLHAGGGIGSNGAVPDVCVELPNALQTFALPEPPSGDELKRASNASIDMLSATPRGAAWALFCAVYRTPLGPCDFAVHYAGDTGEGKTALASLGQQHFGLGATDRNLPASWSSTGNALEGLSFFAKDVIMVVDDFAPHGTVYDVQRIHREADRLLRAQGNRSGRQRMRADGSLQTTKYPRGMIVSTGEDIPRGSSLRARMFVVEIGAGDVAWDALTLCQKHAREGLYAAALAGYVRWLADGNYDAIRKRLRQEVEELRYEFTRSGQHKRTPGIIADLAVGLRYFVLFAQDSGVLNEKDAEYLWKEGLSNLQRLAAAQDRHIGASDPVRRFFELLASALTSGEAHVASRVGDEPKVPEAWGWRQHAVGTGDYRRDEWRPQGARIGWIEGDDLYLDLNAALKTAQGAAGPGGESISISPTVLNKRLHERRLLRSTDPKRQTLAVRRKLEGRTRAVIHLAVSTLLKNPTYPTSGPKKAVNGETDTDSNVGLPDTDTPEPDINVGSPDIENQPTDNEYKSAGAECRVCRVSEGEGEAWGEV